MSDRPYDLEERTAKFGEAIIGFAKRVPVKDFRHKIATCKKESRETKHWTRMVVTAEPSLREEAKTLWQEAKELNLIFASIRNSTGRR